MTFRRAVFWVHLSAGLTAGAFIMLMSATGVMLAFEKQILSFAVNRSMAVGTFSGEPLTADELLAPARAATGSDGAIRISFANYDGAPVVVKAGRRGKNTYLNPYTGAVLENSVQGLESFFKKVEWLHRWLAFEGEARNTGRAVMGAANAVFLFLIASGLFLWFPKKWIQPAIKKRLFFTVSSQTAKARDWNWHHVFGFWAVIPLFVIALTALPLSYGWARNIVSNAFDNSQTEQSGPPERRERGASTADFAAPPADRNPALLQTALDDVSQRAERWAVITIETPFTTSTQVSATVFQRVGADPTRRVQYLYDVVSGELMGTKRFADNPPAHKARLIYRFLHTGELLGAFGQLVAALASLAGCFLSYTGIVLAYRRLIVPLLSKRKAA